MDLPELWVNGHPLSESAHAVGEAAAVEFSCSPIPGARSARLGVGGDCLGAPIIRFGEDWWRWEWRPLGRAGGFIVRLEGEAVDGQPFLREYTLLVASGKLEQVEFDALLEAIQQTAIGLVYMLGGGMLAANLGAASGAGFTLIEEYWTRLSSQARLATAITRSLTRSPRFTQRRREEELPLGEVVDLPLASLARTAERPLEAAPATMVSTHLHAFPRDMLGRIQLPHSLPARITERDYAMYEHRILVRCLVELEARCRTVQSAIRRELAHVGRYAEKPSAERQAVLLREWNARAGAAAEALGRCRAADFLVGVEPVGMWRGMTDLMRREPRYRRIGELWTMLMERPLLTREDPLFEAPVADLPTLYERWCLLEVARALEPVGELLDQQLIEPSSDRARGAVPPTWRLRFGEDQPLICRKRRDGALVSLYYQRRYPPVERESRRIGSLDPFLRIPDIAVEVTASGRPPAVLLFDAKYRVAQGGGIPEDSMADAYTYQAAIGSEGVPTCLATYLLFPGSQGFQVQGVGAVPLAPGKVGALDLLVRQHLCGPVLP